MNRATVTRILLLFSMLLVFGVSLTQAQEASGIDEAWWQEAGQAFAGTTLHGVSESTPPSNYVREVLAPRFTELTGINVELETTSWDQMYDKAIRDMEAGTDSTTSFTSSRTSSTAILGE
jgi:multiple sugar transport system substrate-binding protein